jgi:hypothetical protein
MDDGKDVSYTYGERPDPSLMSPRYTQPGRKWIPLHGPYKGKLGAEHCATHDFEWLGLMFPGESEYQVFNLEDLQPAD